MSELVNTVLFKNISTSNSEQQIEEYLSNLGIDALTKHHLLLCHNEVIHEIICYGKKEKTNIDLTINKYSDYLEMIYSNDNDRFNGENIDSKEMVSHDLSVSSIKKMVDELSYDYVDNKNVIKLTKRLS